MAARPRPWRIRHIHSFFGLAEHTPFQDLQPKEACPNESTDGKDGNTIVYQSLHDVLLLFSRGEFHFCSFLVNPKSRDFKN